MTYRDETEALRAHLAATDAELEALRIELEKARGVLSAAPEGVSENPLAGGPTELHLSRTVDGELSIDDHGELLAAIQTALGTAGTPSTLGRSLIYSSHQNSGRTLQISLGAKNGKTTIRVDERFGQLIGGLFGGIVGGAGGGGLAMVVAPILASNPSGSGAALAALVAVCWVGSVFLGTRTLYGFLARRRVKESQRLVAAVERAVSEAISSRKDMPRVRVVSTEEEGREELDEAEAELPEARSEPRKKKR